MQESPAKCIPSLHHLRSRELSFFFSFRLRLQTLESPPDVVEWLERVKTNIPDVILANVLENSTNQSG